MQRDLRQKFCFALADSCFSLSLLLANLIRFHRQEFIFHLISNADCFSFKTDVSEDNWVFGMSIHFLIILFYVCWFKVRIAPLPDELNPYLFCFIFTVCILKQNN